MTTFPIITLNDGDVSNPQWFADITNAVNDHEGRISTIYGLLTSFYGTSGQSTTSGFDTTTSATFVNCAGTGNLSSFSFTKVFANTSVLLDVQTSFFTSVAAGGAEFALRINGTDYTCTHENASATGVATKVGGWAIATGIPVGVYTVQARWRRYLGTGTCQRGTDQWMSISAREIN